MTTQRQVVDVVMERVPLASRWASERWQPAAVSIGRAPSVHPGATLERGGAGGEQWRFRGFEIELNRSEAEGYWLNMTTSVPRVFVMWRMSEEGATPPAHPVIVTVSYNEAARFMDGGEQVDNVPMVREIAEWVQAFVAANYKPEPRRKVKRNDPFADDAADPGGNGGPRR
ncbi:MAG TPA: DUF3305 domain-containing protein [Casimicrobiaceae bacterium]|nr:DUF3305 domain-containing protein [Casimicrobiaceae bacterium]